MPRFFALGTNLLGGRAIIRGRDAEHIKVLRLRPGEEMGPVSVTYNPNHQQPNVWG